MTRAVCLGLLFQLVSVHGVPRLKHLDSTDQLLRLRKDALTDFFCYGMKGEVGLGSLLQFFDRLLR